ncbi:gephyrin-like molybdotransferase Glp [uncultured Albimonas sp.]|uniref:molybdopterin molybdotransferase MoeA n=1 Tax=uncultured Albimonas sp. TaxID=1331701 RepID=UPI0030EB567B|tara:strand:+ start:1142 stop:2341 length:1200 start_codon:yes stop_codon:yes gene_type:complete
MIPTAEALSRILSLVSPVTGTQTVPLLEAAGRVLAAPARARRTQPPFSASAMDGYAIRNADLRPGAEFSVIGESQAGLRFAGRVGPGEAVRIFTGAPVPEGADRVLIQEDAERRGNRIRARDNLDAGTHIRPAGGDFSEGDALSAPRRLSPRDVSLLAAMNLAEVEVLRRPVVAIVATGDELVEPGETPGPDQIVSSNSYGLHALLAARGAAPRLAPIARDTLESLAAAFAAVAEADLVVTLGGASVGDHDLVSQAAGEAGLELDFWKVNMRPGKPLMAGRLPGAAGPRPLLGLPGNPVSAMVCAELFLLPAVDALSGLPAAPRARLPARLLEGVGANGPREHFARGRLTPGPQGLGVRVLGRQDSSLLSVLAEADALVVLPPNAPAMEAGETVEVIPL